MTLTLDYVLPACLASFHPTHSDALEHVSAPSFYYPNCVNPPNPNATSGYALTRRLYNPVCLEFAYVKKPCSKMHALSWL